MALAQDEGKRAKLSVRAGGAQKIYWVIKRGGKESVAAVDRFTFTFDAGRVGGDESLTLRLKVVYANSVKTVDIPVTIREAIPEPVVMLKAPAKWDGRKTIEVVPRIVNRSQMLACGAGDVTVDFDRSTSGLCRRWRKAGEVCGCRVGFEI